MKNISSPQLLTRSATASSGEQGAALIITLAFIVILLVLTLAFFSRSTQQQQISKSSSSSSVVDLFAEGAVESIVGDLRQEIVSGSTVTPVATINGQVSYVYYPTINSNMVPAISGFTTNAGLENLVKISGGTPFNGPINRATANSTTNSSLNGRSISPARWNDALFLPVTAINDYTPIASANFTPPSWILVDRSGNNPTTWNANIQWNSANSTTVIGRYAYTIYNEGGVLDANVAGYPPAMTNAGVIANPALLPAYKGGEYFADLTQIGLTTTQINVLLGWRNGNESLAPNNVTQYPKYTNTQPTTLTNYGMAVIGNTNGFLSILSTNQRSITVPVKATTSDHQFTSRQQLISFLINADTSNGALSKALSGLNYLSTFTRALEQPSYAPIINLPVAATNAGGNMASGFESAINPKFLTNRVTASFTRNDGTIAQTGEPLVKKRFALNRLAWLTYLGPISDGTGAAGSTTVNANASIQAIADILHNTYGMSYAFLQQGTAAHIQQYFGLTWQQDTVTLDSNDPNSGQFKWFYNNHLAPTGIATSGSLMRLGGIAAMASNQREPDFFELLKATINVGSLGKSSSISSTGSLDQAWQFNRDIDVDAHIMQIGVNIIDQSNITGYPTRIIWDNSNNSSKPREFRGAKNLPYIYRIRYTYFKSRMSIPDTSNYYSALTASGGGSFVNTSGMATTPNTAILLAPNSTGTAAGINLPPMLSDTGLVLIMNIPDVWNPYDQNSSRGAVDSSGNALYPTQFRVVAQSAPPDPGGSLVAMNSQMSAPIGYMVSANTMLNTGVAFLLYTDASNGWGGHSRNITTHNSGLYFSIINTTAAAGLFREPTALFKVGVPVGSSLSGKDPTPNGEDNALIHGHRLSDPAPFANDDGNIANFASGSGSSDGTLADVNMATGFGYNPNKEPVAGGKYLGFYLQGGCLASLTTDSDHDWVTARNLGTVSPAMTYQTQCLLNGKWITYDEKYASGSLGNMFNQWVQDGSSFPYAAMPGGGGHNANNYSHWLDPRTSRYGSIGNIAPPFNYSLNYPSCLAPGSVVSPVAWPVGVSSGVLDQANWVVTPDRPDFEGGRSWTWPNNNWSAAGGFYPNSGMFQPELYSQNRTDVASDRKQYSGDPTPVTIAPAQYYTDADNVVRRAAGAYALPSGTTPASNPPVGVPQPMGGTVAAGVSTPNSQSQSQPIVLNRPFRSVSELGYVFKGTPWKNLDFFTPESGDSALLDVFCINDTTDPNGMVAGRVDLNTRQIPVLQSILNGGYKDETAQYTPPPIGYTPLVALTQTDATNIASYLVRRTSTNGTTISGTPSTPLINISDLVGRWVSSVPAPSGGIDGSKSYDGFSADLDKVNFSAGGAANTAIQRFREAAMRPLVAAGQTRVWNLMIDVVAQTGKYPQTANSLSNFTVEGEQRYWVHIAIDRLTGQILDKQIEVIKE